MDQSLVANEDHPNTILVTHSSFSEWNPIANECWCKKVVKTQPPKYGLGWTTNQN